MALPLGLGLGLGFRVFLVSTDTNYFLDPRNITVRPCITARDPINFVFLMNINHKSNRNAKTTTKTSFVFFIECSQLRFINSTLHNASHHLSFLGVPT